jgi:hypothetical protein
LPNTKTKEKDLTVKEVKNIIYKQFRRSKSPSIQKKFNTRIVEDNLAEVEAMQQIHAMILDEVIRRKRDSSNYNGQTTLNPVQDKRLK